MAEFETLRIHRAMMASRRDADVAWWYFGTTYARPEGYPEIAALQAETIMIYRTETLAENAYRIHWREIGYFRDPVSGEVATNWLNPVTGATVAAPNNFEEGPSHYTIMQEHESLSISLHQAHATVKGITAHIRGDHGRLQLTQTEHKVRGFPLPDGTMPQAGSSALNETTTVLSLFADQDSLFAGDDVACAGLYSFELSGMPPWMGFNGIQGRTMVSGVMRKSQVQDRVNESAWTRLRQAFPRYFSGELLAPPWP